MPKATRVSQTLSPPLLCGDLWNVRAGGYRALRCWGRLVKLPPLNLKSTKFENRFSHTPCGVPFARSKHHGTSNSQFCDHRFWSRRRLPEVHSTRAYILDRVQVVPAGHAHARSVQRGFGWVIKTCHHCFIVYAAAAESEIDPRLRLDHSSSILI